MVLIVLFIPLPQFGTINETLEEVESWEISRVSSLPQLLFSKLGSLDLGPSRTDNTYHTLSPIQLSVSVVANWP